MEDHDVAGYIDVALIDTKLSELADRALDRRRCCDREISVSHASNADLVNLFQRDRKTTLSIEVWLRNRLTSERLPNRYLFSRSINTIALSKITRRRTPKSDVMSHDHTGSGRAKVVRVKVNPQSRPTPS